VVKSTALLTRRPPERVVRGFESHSLRHFEGYMPTDFDYRQHFEDDAQIYNRLLEAHRLLEDTLITFEEYHVIIDADLEERIRLYLEKVHAAK
jgi:hypothetical protein